MDSNLIGALFDNGILCGLGILMTLFAFRLIGKPPGADAARDKWFERHGRSARMVGPVMIALSVVLFSNRVASDNFNHHGLSSAAASTDPAGSPEATPRDDRPTD